MIDDIDFGALLAKIEGRSTITVITIDQALKKIHGVLPPATVMKISKIVGEITDDKRLLEECKEFMAFELLWVSRMEL